MTTAGPTAGPWAAADTSPQRSQSFVIEFTLFALLPLPLTVPVINLPLPEIAGLALLARAAFRSFPKDLGRPLWFPLLLGALWLWFALSAWDNGVDGTRRLGHLAIYIGVALALSSGRLHRVSAIRGIAFGLTVGVLSGFVFRFLDLNEGYAGRLTGIFFDPNVAGFTMVVLGTAAVSGARSGVRRAIGLVGLLVAIGLTLSRTSLIAAALAAVWLVMRRLVSGPIALTGIVGITYLITEQASRLQYWGPFADREGSDILRARILEQEQVLLEQRPIVGRGPGTSFVLLEQDQFFFHNSFLSLRNEGGWVAFIIFTGLLLAVMIRLVTMPAGTRHPWYEASLITVAVCGLNLGEVLLEMPTAVVLGLAMRHSLVPHELRDVDGDVTDHVF